MGRTILRAFRFTLLSLAGASAQTLVQASQSPATLANRGAALYKIGNYREAGPFLLQSIALWERSGSLFDDNYASALNDLAAVYMRQARFADAEKLYLRALSIREHNSASATPAHATVLHNLARLYSEMNRLESAENFASRALEIRQSLAAAGNATPDLQVAIAQTLDLRGLILQSTGRVSAASTLYRQALDISRRSLAATDPRLAEPLLDLGAIARLQGDLPRAEALLSEAVNLLRSYAPYDPLLPAALNNLGLLARAERDSRRAALLFNQALPIWKNTVGTDSPEYASTLSNLGLVYQDRHQFQKAQDMFRRSLEIHQSTLGPADPRIGDDLINLGQLAFAMRREAEAKLLFTRAIDAESTRLPKPTCITGFAQACLAQIAANHHDFGAAASLFQSAIAILDSATVPDDPRLVAILRSYAHVLKARGRFAEAEQTELKATRIRVRNAILANAPVTAKPAG